MVGLLSELRESKKRRDDSVYIIYLYNWSYNYYTCLDLVGVSVYRMYVCGKKIKL